MDSVMQMAGLVSRELPTSWYGERHVPGISPAALCTGPAGLLQVWTVCD